MPPGHAAVNKAEEQVPAHEPGLLQPHVVGHIGTVLYVENSRFCAFPFPIKSKLPNNVDWIRPLFAWGATSLGIRVLYIWVFDEVVHYRSWLFVVVVFFFCDRPSSGFLLL